MPPPRELTRYERVTTARGAIAKGALGIIRQLVAFGASPQATSGVIRRMFPNLRVGESSALYQKIMQPYRAAKMAMQLPAGGTLPAGEIPIITPKFGQLGRGTIPGYHWRVTVSYLRGDSVTPEFMSRVIYSSRNQSTEWVLNAAKMEFAAYAATRTGDYKRNAGQRFAPVEFLIRSIKRVTMAGQDIQGLPGQYAPE